MTERVGRRDRDSVVDREDPVVFVPESAPSRNVTAAIVDRAVDETLEEARVAPDVAAVIRSLMSADTASAVAQAYYHGVATGEGYTVNPGVEKFSLDIPYVLTDVQVAALSKYASDFSLRFSPRVSHDHPVAAATRMVDRKLVEARLPPRVQVTHVGGALVPLVTSGRLGHGHHACVPVFDRKDPSRAVLQKLELRRIRDDVGRSSTVRDSATGALDGRVAYACGKRVQDCKFTSRVLVSVHVYDVPMADWPKIMDNKGASVVEGCLLFPQGLFHNSVGEMPVAGARYEVDALKDRFRMGFVDSPSWWYDHKLSHYMLYGVDQVLSNGAARYSYKVVERRGDTLFFRILRVSDVTLPEYRQYYQVPQIPMVRVRGFSVARSGSLVSGRSRAVHLFPQFLWEDMLGHAKEMVERGVVSHEKLFNYYRTVAPRQSINSVVVSGGATVENLDDLMPLILHVVMFAWLEVHKTKVEIQAVLDSEMIARVREKEWTMYKVLAAFAKGLLKTAGLVIAPLVYVADLVDRNARTLLLSRTYDWDVEPVVQRVSAKLLMPLTYCDSSYSATDDFNEAYAVEAPMDLVHGAAADPTLAEFVLDAFSSALSGDVRERLKGVVDAAKEESLEETQVDGAIPSKVVEPVAATVATPSVGTAFTAEVDSVEVERRRTSILEAIDECRAEAKKTEGFCGQSWRDLVVGGQPLLPKMVTFKETLKNPEFWYVSRGVIDRSLSGSPVAGFQHAAVYSPVAYDGANVITVYEEEFKGMSCGEYVERVYYKLSACDYTGYVLTNDSLLIYNGPAIEKALHDALTLPLDFHVTLNQGPPGCGKTTMIVNQVKPSDVVLVPVRKAARETSGRVRDKGRDYQELASKRVKTLDSYLVNRTRDKYLKTLSSERLLADEAFMTREGRWLAAAAHLRCTLVEAYGDVKQIPHVPRADCSSLHVSVVPQREEATYVTYRCPAQNVACWGSVYDWKIRSASKVQGTVEQVASTLSRAVPSGCVMMGMYQSDKKVLKEKYAGCGVPIEIMTVHESEGNTYKHVWLHRFDVRKRTDTFSLYDKVEYALVAMSRNTHSFVYVSPPLGDVVSHMIDLGKDSRRINAASELSSAGVTKEML